jgi:hypothetical protein
MKSERRISRKITLKVILMELNNFLMPRFCEMKARLRIVSIKIRKRVMVSIVMVA